MTQNLNTVIVVTSKL